MAKVLTRLVRSGLLVSHQGVHGGYELAQPPAATSVAAVLEAIDGPLTMTACTHGDDGCDQFSKCIVRDPLRRIRDRIAAVLAECSILEIVADPEPSAPPVRVMSSPAMRRVSALGVEEAMIEIRESAARQIRKCSRSSTWKRVACGSG